MSSVIGKSVAISPSDDVTDAETLLVFLAVSIHPDGYTGNFEASGGPMSIFEFSYPLVEGPTLESPQLSR